MFVYIIEGPAGSGKTTLMNRMLDSWNEQLEQEDAVFYDGRPNNKPRSYAGPVGLMQATQKDMYTLATLITSKHNIVFLDRWVLSSLVYDSLRLEGPPVSQTLVNLTIAYWMGIVSNLKEALECRDRLIQDEIQFNWMFHIPPVEIIEERRAKSKQSYPFPAKEEWWKYMQLYNYMQEVDTISLDKDIEVSVQDVTYGTWEW